MLRSLGVLALAGLIAPATSPTPPCADEVTVWADGKPAGQVCAADAPARGLTVIDLGDAWTPVALAGEDDHDAPPYHDTYLALAAERWRDAADEGALARADRYLELFGIEPTLAVVRARLDDDARHRCHRAIDPLALATAPRTRAAIRAAQAHLACDGLYDGPDDGALTPATVDAITRFQRGAMILPHGVLDDDTRVALLTDSRERDFRAALRVLRERVVAATGLVEDGTAGRGETAVLGRPLEPPSTWRVRGHAPLDDAAPDLIDPATEIAARALGWTDPLAARAWLDAHADPALRVAIALPPPPTYHGPAMELSADIDRGDVWLDASPTVHDAFRRPALILYAKDGDRRIPLARWPTTIGGWQDAKRGDDVEPRWKESPVGPRLWRDLYVGPTWLAPDSTPDRELVRTGPDGETELAPWTFGPSYRSAYGLIVLVHHRRIGRGAAARLDDEGLRTHGTGNLVSIATGLSHGCHRLLGLHAMRLAGFLLTHHAHVHRGPIATTYRRTVRWNGVFKARVDTRGELIELVPPVPVEVLPGRVHDDR